MQLGAISHLLRFVKCFDSWPAVAAIAICAPGHQKRSPAVAVTSDLP